MLSNWHSTDYEMVTNKYINENYYDNSSDILIV